MLSIGMLIGRTSHGVSPTLPAGRLALFVHLVSSMRSGLASSNGHRPTALPFMFSGDMKPPNEFLYFSPSSDVSMTVVAEARTHEARPIALSF